MTGIPDGRYQDKEVQQSVSPISTAIWDNPFQTVIFFLEGKIQKVLIQSGGV